MKYTIALFSALFGFVNLCAQTNKNDPPKAQAPKASNSQTTQKPAQQPVKKTVQQPVKKSVRRPAKKVTLPTFSKNPAVAEFIGIMVANYKFNEKILVDQFSRINPNQRVLTLFRPTPPSPPSQTPPKPVVRSWKKYRAQFLNAGRIEGGAKFWLENAATLKRAYDQYGVPPEIIISIIGVETMYGKHTGGFCVMEALATLAFHDPRRGNFFRLELEHFLLLARENGFEPLKSQGSYAGAMGIPQFMPGSWRKYAVDYDGDKKIDLENSVADSIGSVANYLNAHGWQKDQAVAHHATISGKVQDDWIKAGILPVLKTEELAAQGVKTDQKPLEIATFIDLPTPGQPTEYWLGYQNFYVITRYNKSSYYAMSVFQLAEAIRLRMNQQKT